MAAFFRVAVILAILYLARFVLAHQRLTDSSDSEDLQREDSWSTSDDSSEKILIYSGVPLYGDGSSEEVYSEESSDKVLMQPVISSDSGRYSEKVLSKSAVPLDSDGSSEKVLTNSGIPSDSERSNEKTLTKSTVLLDSGRSSDKVLTKSAVPFDSDGSSEEVLTNSGIPSDSEGSNEKSLTKSTVLLDSGGSTEKALKQSADPVKKDGSSEKVLIKSGVPLRGRKIHHTAWSEEDKVQESNENLPQPTENGEEQFYDSWSLRKALNYILSFVYDVEDGGVISNFDPNTPDNPEGKIKSQKSDSDKVMVVPKAQDYPKEEEAGNLSRYIRNRDSNLLATPDYLTTYYENQDMEWFENGAGNLNIDTRYSAHDYEDNDDELPYEDTDFEYEEEFSDEPEDERSIDHRQRGQPKNIDSKVFKQHERGIQKPSKNQHLYKVLENEPAFEIEHLHQRGRSAKEVNKNIHKKIKEDDIQLHSGPNLNSNIREPRKDIKLIKTPTYFSEKPAVKDNSKDTENSAIVSNQEKTVGIITSRENKIATEKKSIKPKKQGNQTMTLKSNGHHLDSKKQNENPLELSEDKAFKSPETSEAKIISKSKISKGMLKKNNLPLSTVSNDLQSDNNDGASLDKSYLGKATIKNKPFTLNTSNQKHPQIKEEHLIKKGNVPDSSTRAHSQPKDKQRLVNTKPPTSVSQRHPQQSPESVGNHVQNKKSKILVVKNNQGGKHEDVRQQATTELQHHKVLKDPTFNTRTTPINSIVGQKIQQSKIQGKKQAIHLPEKKSPNVHVMPSNLPQNVKTSKKLLKENGTKHSKPKSKTLSDIYTDLEPDENVGSYNYLLDSFEFIRVDENNQNKVKKKKDNSAYVLAKDVKHGAQQRAPTVFLEPPSASKHRREHEVKDESHEVFGTILEYLYKNSNNSFLLSLKENNSSVS